MVQSVAIRSEVGVVISDDWWSRALDFAITDLASDATSNRVAVAYRYFRDPIADGQLNRVLVEVSCQMRVEEVVEVYQLDASGAPKVHVVQFVDGKTKPSASVCVDSDLHLGAWRLSDEHISPEIVRIVESRCRHVSDGVWCTQCPIGSDLEAKSPRSKGDRVDDPDKQRKGDARNMTIIERVRSLSFSHVVSIYQHKANLRGLEE
jgi:hypothetical protein